MANDDEKDLNFKVGTHFHTEFKSAAARRRMSMKELFEECFTLWLGHQDRRRILELLMDRQEKEISEARDGK